MPSYTRIHKDRLQLLTTNTIQWEFSPTIKQSVLKNNYPGPASGCKYMRAEKNTLHPASAICLLTLSLGLVKLENVLAFIVSPLQRDQLQVVHEFNSTASSCLYQEPSRRKQPQGLDGK